MLFRALGWIAKPSESRIKEFICGRSAPTRTLSIEGPAKNQLRRAIVFSSHPSQPMVHERRLPDSSPSNDGGQIHPLVRPSVIQKGDVLLSTKKIASCNGQSGYGDPFRCKSSRRFASSDTRGSRGRLLQTLTSDSTPCIDSACYRWYPLEQLVWSLESLCRIFLKEFLKENYDRLWNIFELFKG
jgi:hypothetical protein